MKNWPGTNIPCIYTYKTPSGDIDIPTFKCVEAIFANILLMVVSLAVLALFVMFVIGGLRYLTSGGDPKAAAAAKGTITYAVIGIFLMSIAYLVFSLIRYFTGVDVLKFEIPINN